MSERDPRIDPRRGDEVKEDGIEVVVMHADDQNRVHYRVRNMMTFGPLSMSAEEWKDFARHAEVIHRGE